MPENTCPLCWLSFDMRPHSHTPVSTPVSSQPQPLVVGLDLSLTATGVSNSQVAHAHVYKSKLRGPARLADIRDHILRWADPDHLVLIEGYSMGGQRGSAGIGQMLGELGGVIRVALYELGIAYVEVPPSTLKKFATGKGNANKTAMCTAAARHNYEGPDDDNAIDAWWLMQLGLYANTDEADRDFDRAYRDEAIAKIEWPAR